MVPRKTVTYLILMPRLQRYVVNQTCPGAVPQAYAFRAFGAWSIDSNSNYHSLTSYIWNARPKNQKLE